MKERYVDYRFEYKGFGTRKSWCKVVVWVHKGKYLVILTEPGTESSGTSVTNVCEGIATKLLSHSGVFKKNVIPEDIVWIEHYSESGYPETFDHIQFEYNKGKNEYVNPSWTHIGDTLTEEKMLTLLLEHKK